MTDNATAQAAQKSTIPHCDSVSVLLRSTPGQLMHVQQVSRPSKPKEWGLNPDRGRVRQTVLGFIFDPVSSHMIIVQAANAAVGQLGPVQGEVNKHETVHQAFVRQCDEEAGVEISSADIRYIGSALCEVPCGSPKAEEFDYQLFHCVFAQMAASAEASTLFSCEETGAYATMTHYKDLWGSIAEQASPIKVALLRQLLQEAAAQQYVPQDIPLR